MPTIGLLLQSFGTCYCFRVRHQIQILRAPVVPLWSTCLHFVHSQSYICIDKAVLSQALKLALQTISQSIKQISQSDAIFSVSTGDERELVDVKLGCLIEVKHLSLEFD